MFFSLSFSPFPSFGGKSAFLSAFASLNHLIFFSWKTIIDKPITFALSSRSHSCNIAEKITAVRPDRYRNRDFVIYGQAKIYSRKKRQERGKRGHEQEIEYFFPYFFFHCKKDLKSHANRSRGGNYPYSKNRDELCVKTISVMMLPKAEKFLHSGRAWQKVSLGGDRRQLDAFPQGKGDRFFAFLIKRSLWERQMRSISIRQREREKEETNDVGGNDTDSSSKENESQWMDRSMETFFSIFPVGNYIFAQKLAMPEIGLPGSSSSEINAYFSFS